MHADRLARCLPGEEVRRRPVLIQRRLVAPDFVDVDQSWLQNVIAERKIDAALFAA